MENFFLPVSIIIPCHNEDRFIGKCLESILGNDYPKNLLELIVIDGMSVDSTREIVKEYIKEHSFIKLLDNPKKITPAALNIGITNSKGDIIMRMDAHARVEKDYISKCVQALNNCNADNVGGIMRTLPQKENVLGKAIALCLSHRFGVGSSYFRIHVDKPTWVDTVFGGCYRKNVFQKVGLFNEKLVRGQDMEYNLRLKKAGGRTMLFPNIVSYYYARSDFMSFLKHNWTNGVWAMLPFVYSDVIPVSLRHLVPLLFVTGLLGLIVLAVEWPIGIMIMTWIGGFYGLVTLGVSAQVAGKERDPRFLFVMPMVFASLHFSYGFGSLWGFLKVVAHKLLRRGHKLSEVRGRC